MNEEIKKQLENAKTEEEAKEIIEKAGIELSDDELEEISGGVIRRRIRMPGSDRKSVG